MAKKKRKKHKKYDSKYYVKYGYSVKDVMKYLPWSYGIIWLYFQDTKKRKEMLKLVEIEKECIVLDGVSEQDYIEQNPLRVPSE
jgi:hypothetical protein